MRAVAQLYGTCACETRRAQVRDSAHGAPHQNRGQLSRSHAILALMWRQHTLETRTRGRGTYDVTAEVDNGIAGSGIETGLAHVFLQHTSASLILCENADPDVRHDLEAFLSRLAPDGDTHYRHDQEGPDDMAAHLRTMLTASSLTIPITRGKLALGTWQGIYLYEHRTAAQTRSIAVTLQGTAG